jgi:hypothetical protein
VQPGETVGEHAIQKTLKRLTRMKTRSNKVLVGLTVDFGRNRWQEWHDEVDDGSSGSYLAAYLCGLGADAGVVV